LNPDFNKVFYVTGKLHFNFKQYLESFKQFQILLSKEHNNFKANTYIGLIILKTSIIYQEKKEAINYFRKALEN